MIHRDYDLRYAVRFLPCTLPVARFIPSHACNGAVVGCHSNWAAEGKGKSLKANDCDMAAGCEACHYELDFGNKLSGEQKREVYLVGRDATRVLLHLKGILVVAPEWRKPKPDEKDVVVDQELRAALPIIRQRPAPRKRPTKTGAQNGRSTVSPSKIYRRPT